MTKLHQIVSAILQDVVHARMVADSYSRDLSRAYGADPILRQFPVPRAHIKEIILDLKLAYNQVLPEGEKEVAGLNIETVLNAYFSAILSYGMTQGWKLVIDGVLTPEFRASWLEQLKTLVVSGDNPSANLVNLEIEEHWDELTKNIWEAMGISLQSFIQGVGQEALDPLFDKMGEVSDIEFPLIQLVDGIQQELMERENEDWHLFLETLELVFSEEPFRSQFQSEVNPIFADKQQLLNLEDPGALANEVTNIFVEMLFPAINEIGQEEVLAQMEALGGPDEIQNTLIGISMETLFPKLELLISDLRPENIIQKFLQSLEARWGGELMERIQQTADTPDFRQAFQEQWFEFVISHRFHNETKEEGRQKVFSIFLNGLGALNQEELSEFEVFSDELDTFFEKINEMVFEALSPQVLTDSTTPEQYDLDVEIRSARLQQLPPEVISSLQLTLTLDDDLWPTLVTEA